MIAAGINSRGPLLARSLPHLIRVLLLASTIALLSSCQNLPRDPQRTTERALERGVIRVGVSEAPPWIKREGDSVSGVDAELIRRFAESRGLKVEWHWGGMEDHLRALEHFELDLVAGGQSEKTPWAGRVGLTRSYATQRSSTGSTKHVLAVPPGENRWLLELERFLAEAKSSSPSESTTAAGQR